MSVLVRKSFQLTYHEIQVKSSINRQLELSGNSVKSLRGEVHGWSFSTLRSRSFREIRVFAVTPGWCPLLVHLTLKYLFVKEEAVYLLLSYLSPSFQLFILCHLADLFLMSDLMFCLLEAEVSYTFVANRLGCLRWSIAWSLAWWYAR